METRKQKKILTPQQVRNRRRKEEQRYQRTSKIRNRLLDLKLLVRRRMTRKQRIIVDVRAGKRPPWPCYHNGTELVYVGPHRAGEMGRGIYRPKGKEEK